MFRRCTKYTYIFENTFTKNPLESEIRKLLVIAFGKHMTSRKYFTLLTEYLASQSSLGIL